VELQWEIVPRYFSFSLNLEVLRERLQLVPLGGATVPTVSPEDLLLILCVHVSKHFWERLLWVCDVAEVVKAHRGMDWGRLMERAAALGSERMLLPGLSLAHNLLEADLPKKVLGRVRAHPGVGTRAERCAKRSLGSPTALAAFSTGPPSTPSIIRCARGGGTGSGTSSARQRSQTNRTGWSGHCRRNFSLILRAETTAASREVWGKIGRACRKMRSPFKAVGAWVEGSFRSYVTTLLGIMSWRVVLAVVLMLLRTATQGAQLLLLVPLMQLVGLDVRQGSVGWLAQIVASAFEFTGVPLTLATVLGAFVLLTAALALLTRWQTIFNFKLGQDFVAVLRQRLYRAIAHTNWLTFSKSRSSDFTHALTTELDRVGVATAFLLQLFTDAILVSVYVLLALRLSAAMTGTVFVAGLILLLLLRRNNRQARYTGEEVSLATNGLYSAATEHLGGMKTAKSYGMEERNADIFSRISERVARMLSKGNRNYAETAFWFTVGSAVILSCILYVSFEILEIPAAGLLLLLFLFNRMIPLFNSIQQSYQQYLNALPAFAGVMDIQTRCEAAAEPRVRSADAVEFRESVRFEGVSFAYGGEGTSPAIRDLDLTIKAGETTAIVGPSGAGKSTLADLVMGLILPDQGSVLVDGKPLSPKRIKSWRDQIGYVAQDTFLFNDTVRANLLWARPDVGEEEIRQALRLAGAEEFVSELPDGLETILGDRGVRLSGGERQRLALARALLREPSLLILDEATSALDSENERRIQRAIEGLHGRMTILIITHRLSTIRGADIIHVLESGRLVESGRWESLVGEEGGRFSALARAQKIVQGSE
jgi:ATP-binding cassette subfamily C protein